MIDFSSVKKVKEVFKGAPHEVKCTKFLNEIVGKEIGEQMGPLQDGQIIHIATDARWSLHELLVYLVSQTGPARLHFCTYAIKEFQARLLGSMKEAGVLTEIHALVDYRFVKFDPQAEQLLKSVATSHKWADRLHGKATVLSNDKWMVCVVGSANFTTNTSRDTLVVCTHRVSAEYWIDWITKKIKE